MVWYNRSVSSSDRSRRQQVRRAVLRGIVTALVTASSLCGGGVRPCYPQPAAIISASQINQTTIWLYQNGVAVLAPEAFILGGGVYTDTDFIGTIDPNTNNIYDPHQDLVGFVVVSAN